MISNDHCSAFHVAISLWALNIKDDYERAHMWLSVFVCVSEHASVCNCVCECVCGIHAIYIRVLTLSLLNALPATITQPDSNVKTLHICSVQTLHCECLIFGCHAWICAHFFPGWIFVVAFIRIPTDLIWQVVITKKLYTFQTKKKRTGTKRKEEEKTFLIFYEILWEGWEN